MEEAQNVLVDMPAHHIGFLRYDRLSDAFTYSLFFPAASSPYSIPKARPKTDHQHAFTQSRRQRRRSRSKPTATHLFCENEAGSDGQRARNGQGEADVLVFDHGVDGRRSWELRSGLATPGAGAQQGIANGRKARACQFVLPAMSTRHPTCVYLFVI